MTANYPSSERHAVQPQSIDVSKIFCRETGTQRASNMRSKTSHVKTGNYKINEKNWENNLCSTSSATARIRIRKSFEAKGLINLEYIRQMKTSWYSMVYIPQNDRPFNNCIARSHTVQPLK